MAINLFSLSKTFLLKYSENLSKADYIYTKLPCIRTRPVVPNLLIPIQKKTLNWNPL